MDAAFEINCATTTDSAGQESREFVLDDHGNGWLATASDLWGAPLRPLSSQSGCLNTPDQGRRREHVANCEACQRDAEALRGSQARSVGEKLKEQELEETRLVDQSQAQSVPFDPDEPDSSILETPLDVSNPDSGVLSEARDAAQFEAILSISGMTCAACTSAIDHALNELPFVETVNVTLMTNSARVIFTGKENLQQIVEMVENLGYEAAAENCNSLSLDERLLKTVGSQRSVLLQIEGMFCKHCPSRIAEAIGARYPETVTIEQPPTSKDPIMKVTYTPLPPIFSIRDIISTIDSAHEYFKSTIHTPPSLEDRSQSMHKHERDRLLVRLLLSLIVAIPTLLIAVVWMSMFPASNGLRKFFEQSTWSGSVARADWALFILATPVFFFAADVFHVRAIKEIRALWRKGSRVPVLQRFYRFGSMNLLISAGTSVAFFASVAVLGTNAKITTSSSGSTSTYFDSVVFLTFFILIGRYLEAYSKAKTGNAIAMLGNLRPREAVLVTSSENSDTISQNNQEKDTSTPTSSTKRIDAKLLEVGDIVIVSHGSTPPADGVIIKGSTKFDESALTGEARAVTKDVDDKVYVGAINVGKSVSVKVTEINGASMLDQIVAVVREGQTKRAPVERVVDIVTGYFVPVITALAIITFVIWFGLGQSGTLSKDYLSGKQGGWAFWSLEFAIAVFVVACPCGIGLAAPTALFVGSGIAAGHGILVRGGGEAFQEASNIDAVVFDKTGTLTEGGDLKVIDHEIVPEPSDAELVWSITKSLEETSSHPLARALLEFAVTHAQETQCSTMQTEAVSISEEPGLGLRGTFKIKSSTSQPVICEAALGSEALMSSIDPTMVQSNYFINTKLFGWKSQARSVALLALRQLADSSSPWSTSSRPEGEDGCCPTIAGSFRVTALFAFSDPLRPSAVSAVATLQSRSIPVYVLSGDNQITASAVASSLSIPQDRVFAGVLPTEKARKIGWLQEHGPKKGKEKATVAFIGDGINDAPALAAADVSISLSSASDIAVNSSSFILLSSSLDSVVTLFDLSARVFRRVKMNFAWAVVYNIVLIPVAAGILFRVRDGGWRLGPVWGSLAMALSSVCVVLSSLALRWQGGWRLDRVWKGEKN